MSVVSGIIGAVAGKKGADAQANAARDAAAVQRQVFTETRQDQTPWRMTGQNALAALSFEAGLGVRPKFAKPFGAPRDVVYEGFKASPGYEFRVDEGARAIERSAAARGGLYSGAAGKALKRFGQGVASDEYNNYLGRLSALAGVGQQSNQTIAQAGQSYAANTGNALMEGGAARASGYKAIAGGAQSALSGAGQLYGFGVGQRWFS